MTYLFIGGPLNGKELVVSEHLNEFIYRERFTAESSNGYRTFKLGTAQGYLKIKFFSIGYGYFYVFKHESLSDAECERLVNERNLYNHGRSQKST